MTIILQNKKIKFHYHILKNYTAGIVLKGWEVKSIKEHRISFVESYVRVDKGELWLRNAQIDPMLSTSSHEIIEPKRNKKRGNFYLND
jgi:SsrA-binding protein